MLSASQQPMVKCHQVHLMRPFSLSYQGPCHCILCYEPVMHVLPAADQLWLLNYQGAS